MRMHARSVLTAAMLVAACSQAWAVDHGGPVPKATSDVLKVYPGTQAHVEQGRVRTIYGAPMGGAATAQASATQWLEQNGQAFGAGVLELSQEWSTPVMDGKFTVFGYKQYLNGFPVELGIARVLVLNGPANQVVYAAGNLAPRPEAGFPKVVLAEEHARQVAQGTKDSAGITVWNPGVLTVFQGNGDWIAPVLTWKLTGQGALDNVKTFFIDAATGQVVFVRDEVVSADVTGTVQGWASAGLYPPDATYAAAVLSLQAMPEIRATIVGGNSVLADRNGAFVIPNPGTTDVTVGTGTNAQTDGFGARWVDVRPQDGAARPTASQTVTPPGPAGLVLNPGATNSAAFAPQTAQINAAIVTETTHNYFKDRAPGFTGLDIVMPANTGVAGTCNAFFNGSSINFYNAGGGCANTSYTTVASHEYGHFIVSALGLAQNAFGEGYGDVTAELIWNDGICGRGFRGTQTSNVRDPVAANIQYPCGGTNNCSTTEVHCCGQIIGAVWWRIRTGYGTALGEPAGLTTARNEEVAWSLITTGGETSANSAGPGTAIQVLTVDDNDGNLSNGTPRYNQIRSAFNAHNIQVPGRIGFQYPSGRPASALPNQTISFPVNVVPLIEQPAPGTATVSYRLGTSGSFTTIPLTQGATNQYTVNIPGGPCLGTVQYYLSAQTTLGNTEKDTWNAPTTLFSTSILPAGTTTVVNLNFQTDPGWTVVNDPSLTSGAWERAVPHTPASSGCPGADADGSGMCWLTDNRAGNNPNFDLDGGPTTLTTGVYDLTGFQDADVFYSRWFSLATTQNDTLRVEASGDGGANWTLLESTGGTSGWIAKSIRLSTINPALLTSQFRVRFVASDNPNDSVYEAGIDAFRIQGYVCSQPNPCYANCDASTAAPVLNVADFTCFLQKYAAADSYANCDASTTAPVLNVADFTCFLQKYSAGCP